MSDTGAAGGLSGEPAGGDPFGTARLRTAALDAWASSPTRFREDANAEEDLRIGGYRDRWLVELAQNAADAARQAGVGGVLRLDVVDGELRAANTGSPLSSEGVASLASLRASAKRDQDTTGRFGVGFAAVLALTDEPSVLSTSGGVTFSAQRTRALASELSGPAGEMAARQGAVPVLRLAWPRDGAPPAGFDTEVRLPLSEGVDGAELLSSLGEQVTDLLLALPALERIEVGDRVLRRYDVEEDHAVVAGPEGSQHWLLHRLTGRLPAATTEDLGTESRGRSDWYVCWAVELDDAGAPVSRQHDVLHAPTPSEERLSVPCRLLASVPMEPDRRRVAASTATDTVLIHAAECYPDVPLKVAPEYRTRLVPLPGFPLSDVDDKLRQAVLDRLRVASWLPAATGGVVAPHEAAVLEHHSPELVELLAEVVPGLLVAELSAAEHAAALNALEVRRLSAAEVVEAVSGLQRPATWWRRLYDALLPIEQQDGRAREEFAALPVLLADGRTVTGPRDVLLTDGAEPGPGEALAKLDISGLRIADPEAGHPLLERLGARPADADELLDAPPLADAVLVSVADAQAGVDVRPLAHAVLRLVRDSGGRDWLGALALPDTSGEFRRADELLLSSAALLDVLNSQAVGPDAALGVLHDEFVRAWSAELLRTVGVLDGFAVVVEEQPAEPHEGLADTEVWWREQGRARPEEWPPARFVGVRDLDLVAENAWPAALRLLTGNPETARALQEPGGYTSWWVARFARLAGHEPRYWRLPAAEGLAGLYDPVPDTGLSEEQLRVAGARVELAVAGAEDAVDLVHRLGDPERKVRAGTALRAHRVLADAVACGTIEPEDVEPPRTVRSLSGAVVTAERAVVLDEPWLLGVFEAPLVVAGGGSDEFDAEALADLLDLSPASEQGPVQVLGQGRSQEWAQVARVPAVCELLGVPMPPGAVVLQDGLRVRIAEGERSVHWWVDASGAVYAERTPDGLARALAWACDHWSERFAMAALLADPDATTLLR